jgi:hypothetical protein
MCFYFMVAMLLAISTKAQTSLVEELSSQTKSSIAYFGLPAPSSSGGAKIYKSTSQPQSAESTSNPTQSENETPFATGDFGKIAPLDETSGNKHHGGKPANPGKVAFYGFGNQSPQKKKQQSAKKFKDWEKAIVLDKYQTKSPTVPPTPKPTAHITGKPTVRPTPSPVPLKPVGGGQRTQICGATTDPLTTFWKLHGTGGLYFDISTTHCKFPKSPNYIFNVVGDKAHWQLAGTSSVSR